MSALKRCSTPSTSATTADTVRPDGVGLQPADDGVADQRDVVVLDRGPDRDHVGVGLGVHQAGEAVAGGTADAGAEGRVGLVEHDPGRASGTGCRPTAVMSSKSRWMRGSWETRREGVRRRCRRLGRVLTAGAVHLVELLGLGVVRLHHVVLDRPGRGDAVVVLELAEVAFAEPVERGPVELRRPTDEVVDLGLEAACRRASNHGRGRRSGCRRRRLSASQFCASRGSQSPRSRISTRLPDGARRWASVPPPAPDPTMITS